MYYIHLNWSEFYDSMKDMMDDGLCLVLVNMFVVVEAGGDVRGSEWYKRVGRKGGERSLMMETTAHILLLCCIGIIQSNMMRDGWLSHLVLFLPLFLIKSH